MTTHHSQLPQVALVAFACDPLSGSEPFNGWMWAHSLAGAGVTVQIVTRIANARHIQDYLVDGMTAHYIPDFEEPRWLPRRVHMYLNYGLFIRKVSKYLRDSSPRFHIVHHVTWGSLNFGAPEPPCDSALIWGPVGGAQQTPRALRPLFVDGWAWERFRNFAVAIGPRVVPSVRQSAKAADVILATNHATRDKLSTLGAKRVEVVIADAVPEMPIKRLPTGDRLLWVGRMLPIKGARLAVEIFHEVLRTRPTATLTMVGDGPDFASVKAMIERLGIKDSVHLTGRIPRVEVEGHYSEASIFLFTSLRDSFGAQVLEAARHSLPLVTFEHQPASAVLPPPARLCVPRDPVETIAQRAAAAIACLMEDATIRSRLSQAAYDFARMNTWPARSALALERYRELTE